MKQGRFGPEDSDETKKRRFEILKRKSPAERLKIAFDRSEELRQLSKAAKLQKPL